MATISKKAVKAFLNKRRDDFRRSKNLSKKEIQLRYEALPNRSPFWKKMRHEQRVCFLIGVETKKFAFYLDTGSGKTLLSIALILYLQEIGHLYRALVLVPYNVNKYEWVREIKKHAPDTTYVVLEGSSEDKWKLLEGADDEIVIATYAGVVHMVCDRVESSKKDKDGKLKLKPNLSKVKRLSKLIDGMVLDESTEVGSKSSLSFRICRKLSQSSNVLFELTGTPFGRDPTPLWSQMFLLDGGETLGPTLGLFRAALYKEKDNYWSGFPEYVFDNKKEKLLHNLLAHKSIRYEANEQDLPKAVFIVKEVAFTADIGAYYQKVKEQLISAHGNYQEMKNAFIRARQISSGFLGYHDDEVGVRAQFEFKVNPKLELLLSLVDSIAPRYKTVVFIDFIFSGSIVCRELKAMSIGHARLYSKTKDPDAQLSKFLNDDDCRILVISSAGAFGLNLQVAKYLIFYESPVSVIIRKQVTRRVERQYSEHETVFIYDLVTRDTYDAKILQAHKEGKDLFETIIEGRSVKKIKRLRL